MLRAITLILLLIAPSWAASDGGPKPLVSALSAARDGRWEDARKLAQRAGPPAGELVEWYKLRAGEGSVPDAIAFLEVHKDWPGLTRLRQKAETQLQNAPDSFALRLLEGHLPSTGIGVIAHAQALLNADRVGEAQTELVLAWRTLKFSADEQAELLALYGPLLADHHTARLDMLLWRGDTTGVERMLPLVDDAHRALAQARLALQDDKPGVDDLIGAVPPLLADDPGLAYDRFNWRIRKGLTEGAIELALERSKTPIGLGRPEAWAGWRRYLARSEMRDGRPRVAYALASSHGLTEGASYADLEWLSGYLALRYLGSPGLALDHFQRFRQAVGTPISQGRAGYWIGRALDALGDEASAQVSYAQAAAFQTSFYGLLSAERAGLTPDPALQGQGTFPNWRDAEFTKSSVFQAGMLLLNANELSQAVFFLTHLARDLDRTGLEQLGQMALDLDAPHLAVMIGKAAAARGIILTGPYYALHPLKNMSLPVPIEMALAIARRESEFNPNVVSGVGAQGLMQLMPATAAQVAGELELNHDNRRVLTDPTYNATLGSAYLASLAKRFGGNPVLVAAAYNAGPSRAERWSKERGDPRNPSVDIVDWIEHIPFRETRNYVMRTTESLPIYRARLGKKVHPIPFSQELKGSGLLR